MSSSGVQIFGVWRPIAALMAMRRRRISGLAQTVANDRVINNLRLACIHQPPTNRAAYGGLVLVRDLMEVGKDSFKHLSVIVTIEDHAVEEEAESVLVIDRGHERGQKVMKGL
jgi:hypothetical protein